MKKLFFLLTVVALIAGCSKKDVKPALAPQTAKAADITGKWQLETDSAFQTQNGQTQINVLNTGGTNIFFTYTSNGQGTFIDNGQVNYTFNCIISNGIIEQLISGEPEQSFTILAISTNRMVLREMNGINGYNDVGLPKQ
jgi:hypothetical protein